MKDSIYLGGGIKEINGMNFRGCLTMMALIYIFYILMIAGGDMVADHFVVFTVINIVFHGIAVFVYLRNKEYKYYKQFMMIAFFITYAYILFDNKNNLVCLLIIAPLVMGILYHDVLFSLISGIITVALNFAFVIYMAFISGNDHLTLASGGFQILMIVLFVIAIVSATAFYADSYKKNTKYTDMLESKSEQLAALTEQTLETLSNAIDAKDHYTEGHSRRVSKYAALIAKQMNLSDEEVDFIKYSALLHDVGKISVRDDVLKKPARLSDEEFKEMKEHTISGGDILGVISTMPGISNSAMYHHERYDGTGYPRGLKGDEIPQTARIIALADAYDPMTSDRVYRKALPEEKVISEIEQASGTQFDPKVVEAFMKIRESIKSNED